MALRENLLESFSRDSMLASSVVNALNEQTDHRRRGLSPARAGFRASRTRWTETKRAPRVGRPLAWSYGL